MSKYQKGKKEWNKNKHLSKENKQNLRTAHLGKKATEETKQKMRKNNARWILGKKRTKKTIEKMKAKTITHTKVSPKK